MWPLAMFSYFLYPWGLRTLLSLAPVPLLKSGASVSQSLILVCHYSFPNLSSLFQCHQDFLSLGPSSSSFLICHSLYFLHFFPIPISQSSTLRTSHLHVSHTLPAFSVSHFFSSTVKPFELVLSVSQPPAPSLSHPVLVRIILTSFIPCPF